MKTQNIQKIYDIHAHYSTEKPGLASDAGKLGFNVHIHTAAEHVETMNHLGIARALISCPTQKYLDDKKACIEYIQEVNDIGASMVRDYPDRFDLCCALPLPYVDEAMEELDRVINSYDVKALILTSNANGQYLGNPQLRPLFEKINSLKLPVLLHPAAPLEYPKGTIAAKVLPMFEFIADTTRTVLDIMAAGYLEDFSDVKLIIPHSGSCLPMAIDRYMQTMRVTGRNPGVHMEQLYFDIACDPYPSCVPALLQITTPDHIFLGSDYPAIPEFVVASNIEHTQSDKYFSKKEIESILWGNAEKLLMS